MCGRFVSITDSDGLVKFFTIDDRQTADLPANVNVAPTEQVYAVAEHAQRRTLVSFMWGLVPHWAEDRRVGSRFINARSDTVASKPAFRAAFTSRRCLIPADGFYEWRRNLDGAKTPHYITAASAQPLAFAGLWAGWKDASHADSPILRTCAIITTEANAQVQPLHDRMPVILPPEHWDEWLDRGNSDTVGLRSLLVPAPDDFLTIRPVSSTVNDARNKDLDILAVAESRA